MILVRQKFLQIGQVWFEASTDSQSALDAIEYIQSPVPIQGGSYPSEFHTLTLDLRQNEETIKKQIHKDTLYEIRRSNRENLQYVPIDHVSEAILKEFCDFYDEFASQKNRGKIGRALLSKYVTANSLHLSCVKDPSGRVLTWHAHLFANSRARLLQSASHFRGNDSSQRSLIGRANRFHHYEDLIYFKNKTFHTYDFGGWYAGNSDLDKLKINHFKEEFGGIRAIEYNAFRAVSLRGKFYFMLRNLKNWIQK